tara:strand:+ start:1568 stop:1723 length:156 start_codon:yes stop_codon:yes gene_type:complete
MNLPFGSFVLHLEVIGFRGLLLAFGDRDTTFVLGGLFINFGTDFFAASVAT